MKRRKRKRFDFNVIFLALITFTVIIFVGYAIYVDYTEHNKSLSLLNNNENKFTDAKDKNETTSKNKIIIETTSKIETTTVTLLAVGDDLIHDSIIQDGRKSDGSYNFDFMFKNILNDIKNTDISVINQETMMGGDLLPYGGYPTFNSPYEVGEAIAKAGFNVVLHATNHARDVYEEGVERTLDFWSKKYPEINVLGINKSQKDKDTIKVIEKNGIKIALLNYTYGLNGYSLSTDKSYLINLIDEDLIESDIKKAKEISDFIIVFPHWGIEYINQANEEQEHLAKIMCDAGADLIIGTHPHVLENIEWITSNDNKHKTLCYYSLGNYISGQDQTSTMLGGMAKVTISKTGSETSIEDGKLVPLITYYDYNLSNTQVYKLSEFPLELESQHGVKVYDSTFSLKAVNEYLDDTIEQKWLIEK